MDLFEQAISANTKRPLADRMRPADLDQFVGQDAVLGSDKMLRRAIENDRLFSMLFWGPPGTGKTSLARIIAKRSRSRFLNYSAVTAGVREIREVVHQASEDLKYRGSRTILFLDEIHRFNKAQQDYLLPHVEDGTILLIGATTENPSFEVNAALLSRLRVFVFEFLSPDDLRQIINFALTDTERGLGEHEHELSPEDADTLISVAGGDARAMLNILEVAAHEALNLGQPRITEDLIQEAAQKRSLLYDKSGEEHFNLISALHKSLRDSDPQAGLYWMGRMLEGGEDPTYIARRLVRFASEDVGLASPGALEQAVAAFQACRYIGMPECALALSQVVVYLATAPKSNALEKAYLAVKEEIARSGHPPVPMHLRNAPTKFMKGQGYGRGYKYAHDYPNAKVSQEHFPPEIRGSRFYEPTDRGFETTIRERMNEHESQEE
jgi:putative ATPase